ncbi:MAG: hypothetical protein ACYSO4_09160 [Planctomycetota bacterium]|jgi:hypothetical protein
MIQPLEKEHAAQVAQLHMTGIPTGFISSLGKKFVAALYESIAQSPMVSIWLPIIQQSFLINISANFNFSN